MELAHGQPSKQRLFAETVAVFFLGIVATVARRYGFEVLLFPELAALAYDVLRRPAGKWARQPFRLVLTPTLTAILGLFAARHFHDGVLPVLAVTLCALGVIRLLHSSIGPAISAGLLPLVLREQRWSYPLAIFADLTCLALLLWFWTRYCLPPPGATVTDKLEGPAKGWLWLFLLLLFVGLLAFAGQSTGFRLVLFPPLVVMAYEILGHPEIPVWARRPFVYPMACVLTAAMGLLALRVLGNGPWSVMAVMAGSIAVLRAFDLHMPPALAVGLIPFLMTQPHISYVLSVAIGSFALSGWALLGAKLRDSFPSPAAALRVP